MRWIPMYNSKMTAHLSPARNTFMMASRSFCGMSPCMEDTVKLASLIFSVSQSTCVKDTLMLDDRLLLKMDCSSLN